MDSLRASRIRASLSDSLRASLAWASLSDSLRASLSDSLWASLSDSLWASLWASLSDSLRASGWIAFYVLPQIAGLVTYEPEQQSRLQAFADFAESAFALWVIPGHVIVLEKPKSVKVVDGKLVEYLVGRMNFTIRPRIIDHGCAVEYLGGADARIDDGPWMNIDEVRAEIRILEKCRKSPITP